MWLHWALAALRVSMPHFILVIDDTAGELCGNVVAVAMIVEWLCLVGAIAAAIQLPEALLYRFVGGMSAGRALLSCVGADLAGGAAYGLTFISPWASGWSHWLAGLGALVGGELAVAWLISRSLPSRFRLLAAVAAVNVALYAVVLTLVNVLR